MRVKHGISYVLMPEEFEQFLAISLKTTPTEIPKTYIRIEYITIPFQTKNAPVPQILPTIDPLLPTGLPSRTILTA